MSSKKRIEEARARLWALALESDGEERVIREKCYMQFLRWARGADVDLARAFAEANTTDRDDIVEPMLDVLSELRLIGGAWWCV